MIISKFLSESMLTAAIGVGGDLASVSIGLMTNEPVSSTETVLTDITAATFDGYAVATAEVPIATVGVAANGERYVTFVDSVFTAGSGLTTPESITGWYVFETTNLLAYNIMPTPVLVDRIGQNIYVRVEVALHAQSELNGDIDSP